MPELVKPATLLGQRVGALLYEAVLLFGVLFFVTALVHTLWPASDAYPWFLRTVLFIALGAYFCYCWHATGQTLAMKTWHLRLVNSGSVDHRGNGQQQISWLKAVVRYCAMWTMLVPGGVLVWAAQLRGANALIVFVASFALMCIAGLLTRERRMLHDWIAGTQMESVRKRRD